MLELGAKKQVSSEDALGKDKCGQVFKSELIDSIFLNN
jgi:hypothetical protein